MSSASDVLDFNLLLRLLTEQRDCYRRLRELGERQRALIAGDQPELLLGILQERRALVGSLARLNEQLAPFRRDWEGTYARLSEPARLQASTLLNEINGLLRVILKSDQEDSALLSARKQGVARELGELAGGRTVNAAYAAQAGGRGGGTADLTG